MDGESSDAGGRQRPARRDAARERTLVRGAVCVALAAVVGLALLVGSGAVGAADGGGERVAGTAVADAPLETDAATGERDPGPGATRASTGQDGAQPADAAALAQAVDADRTHADVALRADGDADWTLTFRVRLEDDDARQAFETLQADVEEDPANYTSDFRERMERTAAAASDATGREMAVEDVRVETEIEELPQAYGVLTYELRWTNFAAVDGERLAAGDAIDSFPMDEQTRLTIRWPEGFALESATPAPDDQTDRRVTWRGSDTTFVSGEPRVVVAPADEGSWVLPAIGVGLLLVGIVAWLVYSGTVTLPGRAPPGTANDSRVSGSADEGAASADAQAEASTAGAAADDGRSAGSGAGADGAEPAGAEAGGATRSAGDDVPEELLSNEEQVLRVLEDNGGRAKQQQVVSELGWTEAKTSQVVTSMHDEGQIEKFRIGRENVLALPGEADL